MLSYRETSSSARNESLDVARNGVLTDAWLEPNLIHFVARLYRK